MCRTLALGQHIYECPECQHRSHVYNSCLDPHCPLCSGGRRADWLDKAAQLLLPKVEYFQIVFTLPEPLWGLMLGHRRASYRLLFRAAWEALREVLREHLGCERELAALCYTPVSLAILLGSNEKPEFTRPPDRPTGCTRWAVGRPRFAFAPDLSRETWRKTLPTPSPGLAPPLESPVARGTIRPADQEGSWC